MNFPGFIGGSYLDSSVNFDLQRAMNLYPEVSGVGTSKNVAKLVGRPGLQIFCQLLGGAIRGILASNDQLFAVCGTDLYQIFADGTFVDRSLLGTGHPLLDDGNPAIMVDNGFGSGGQLVIASGGSLYCDAGSGPINVFYSIGSGVCDVGAGGAITRISGTPFDVGWVGDRIIIDGAVATISAVADVDHLTAGGVTLPVASNVNFVVSDPSDASSTVLANYVTYLDGYFIVSNFASAQFNISGVRDALSWDPLDFAFKDAYPDNIATVYAEHEQIWIQGLEHATEQWQDTGAANFPFQPNRSGLINLGSQAPFSLVTLMNGIAWLAIDSDRGGVMAVYAEGGVPKRVSTPAVENAWSQYATVADAVAYSMMQDGHNFWVISFPTGNATWVFDGTTGLWHERGWWNGTSIDRDRGTFHAFASLAAHGGSAAAPARHFVGDWQNGNIWLQSPAYLADGSTPIHKIRTCPHISRENKWNFYSRLELDMEVGAGGPPTINPVLDWSDNHGHTFGTAHPFPAGATSDLGFSTRVMWRRLGKSRDRVFRITISDNIKPTLINAYLDFTTEHP